MSYTNRRAALAQYGQASTQSAVTTASPHRLIQMLMDGALEKIAQAKGYMERGETAEKGRHIGWAISIVDGLRSSLDHEAGGDVAASLEQLYDYINRRLVEANIRNSTEYLDEVAGLLRQIKTAWDEMPQEVRNTRTSAVDQIIANASA